MSGEAAIGEEIVWFAGTKIKPMSLLWRNGFSAPIEAMMFREFGCTGHLETSWFHGLSGGKTCRAARILSASGVSNVTGLEIGGMGGRVRLCGGADSATLAKPTATAAYSPKRSVRVTAFS